MKTKRYFFLNLGCPKNQVDGDHLRGALLKNGLKEMREPDNADFIIVNTCAFINQARLETKGEIEELSRYKKNGTKLIAIGCYPVLRNIKNEIPGVDEAFAYDRQSEFLKYISGNQNACWNPEEHTRINPGAIFGYVKISDGCDNRCSYCAIPFIRGRYRSYPPENIIAETKTLVAYGVKEIVLVAQDTAIYGKDLEIGINLADLCASLAEVSGVEWIRIMYAHPAHLNDFLIERIFSIDKVCRYVDMPIQHISNRILRAMNRPVDSNGIKHLIKQLRNYDNDVSLRTTLMVGFPGESDDDFKELVDFVEESQFDHVGAFCYSPEENTVACSMPNQVDPELAKERFELLIETAERYSTDRAVRMIGKRQKLLIEGMSSEDASCFEARSQRQAPGIDGYYRVRRQPGL